MFKLANVVVAADPFVTRFEKRCDLEQFFFQLCIYAIRFSAPKLAPK